MAICIVFQRRDGAVAYLHGLSHNVSLIIHPVQDADSAAKGDKGFKAAKEADRRASAGNRSAWNTLFMRPDTVAAAIAEHYGVSRAELLDRDAAGIASQVFRSPVCFPMLDL